MSLRKKVPEKTKRILYLTSRNKCAFPECNSTLVAPPTEKSSHKIVGEICHIYSEKERGPRGRSGLTSEEYNDYDNLIVLCPNHHTLVDGQHETYKAKTLKEWKQTHEAKSYKVSPEHLEAPSEVFYHHYFPTALVDQTIEEEVDLLRKSRFFVEFDGVGRALTLSKRLSQGDLYGGSTSVKAWALAWCARILAGRDRLDKAEEYLEIAKNLGGNTKIEGAFICSRKRDKNTALKILAEVDSPNARSAALIIVGHHDYPKGAIDWLKNSGLDVSDLDADGKFILLQYQLELGQWEAARESTKSLCESDLEEVPVLHHMIAMSYLLGTVPLDYRNAVLRHVPFEAGSFPLASDAAAIKDRRNALCSFNAAAEAAQQLGFPHAATEIEGYVLWIKLTDPKHYERGRQRLEEKMDDLKSALHLVPLALQYGIPLDLTEVEQEIEQQIFLQGDTPQGAAFACLALARTQRNPEEITNYIDLHYDTLSTHLDKKAIRLIQIEMLAKAGQTDRAIKHLELLTEAGLFEVEKSRLRVAIAKAEGKDTLEARKALFRQSDSLIDLEALVNELESKEEWSDSSKYGEILFERTRSLRDAERLANALYSANRTDRIVELLEANAGIMEQSTNLQVIYCWSLYHEGRLLEARSELAKLNPDPENEHYRALQANLGIALEDWNSLSTFIANEIRHLENRSAHEIIGAAGLSLHMSLPNAKQLLLKATEKGTDDPDVLAAAFFLATKAGWENDVEVAPWLQRAAELSGDDGPILSMTIDDVLEQKAEWVRQESEIWQALQRGGIPMFLAAQLLNKSLTKLMLFPAYTNLLQNDPRHKVVIPVYSGKRQIKSFSTGGTTCLDATALLTLSFLDILETTFNAFDNIYVPHSIFAWLFDEKQSAEFHQPSRISDAHQVRNLLATGILEKFSPTTTADDALADQVGSDLAMLLAEAENAIGEDPQRLVVRPSPVPRVDLRTDDEADLTKHASVLSSCQFILDKLRQKGRITKKDEKRAREYLQSHEKPWPQQPEVSEKAILYLDDLAVSYLLHLGLLDKLSPAGFKSIVSPRMTTDVNDLISYEYISNEVQLAVERIRSVISQHIESGKVTVGRRVKIDEGENQSDFEHPTAGVFSLAKDCDAIIVDDRFINEHEYIEDGNSRTPLFSTLDLLDALASGGFIAPADRVEYRTKLRNAACFFVPVSEDELTELLNTSTVNDGNLYEIAELRAIRENLLHVKMGNWLQLPKEATWPDVTEKAFVRTLRTLWSVEVDLPSVIARSNWIVDQLHIDNGDGVLKAGRAELILALLIPPTDAPQEVRESYRSWAEEKILVPVREHYPDLYAWVVASYRNRIADFADQEQIEGIDVAEIPNGRALLAQASLEHAPLLIQQTLLDDAHFREEFGFKRDLVLEFGNSELSIRRSELYDAIRQVFLGESELTVTDAEGKDWSLSVERDEGQSAALVISNNDRLITLLPHMTLSTDKSERLRSVNNVTRDFNLPIKTRDIWRNLVSERALDNDKVDEFYNDFCDTPIHVIHSIRTEIMEGKGSVSSLVPRSKRYFDRLVGLYDKSESIWNYAAGQGRKLFDNLSAWRPYDGFLFSLLLSSHPALTDEISVKRLTDADLARAFVFLVDRGDRISQLGAIEVGFRVLPERPEIQHELIRLIKKIRDDNTNGPESEFRLLSALFLFVDGELSRTRLLSAQPPFYRRLASLSQAALLCRQFLNSGIAIDPLCEWAAINRAGNFNLQSLVDMRLGPYWCPEFAVPSQVRASFCGRILDVAKSYEENISGTELHDLVLGTGPDSLLSLAEFPDTFFPGPLEGDEIKANALPDFISAEIEAQLRAEQVGLSSFVALINFAPIFRVESSQSALAAETLKRGNYRFVDIEDKSQLLTALNGLASVAAVTRSCTLAKELRILVRTFRQSSKYALSVEEALRVLLSAAASHADLEDWSEYVGACLTEFAFAELEGDDWAVLNSHLQYLCHSVPELWAHCRKAEAALKALANR